MSAFRRSGLDIVTDPRQESPRTRILVMSADDWTVVLPRACEAGADGWLDKARLASDLLPALGCPPS
jgi:DNA-binding NarL/FixJ family response regulator